ncbi:hypothetical protein T484DRAFT_1910814, partial [Baffinella frigidus]
MEDLRILVAGIERKLHEQQQLAVRRWSLRGHRSKARQAHEDIDLLFDEAAMVTAPVNEPFMDLIASMVAAVGPVEGLVLKRGPVKKPERALQKLVRVYGRDVAMLTDLVRCSVIAEDLRQVEALMSSLDARSVVGLVGLARRSEDGDPSVSRNQEELVELLDLNKVDERIF